MSGTAVGYVKECYRWNEAEDVPAAALFDLSFKVRGPALLMLHKAQPVTFTPPLFLCSATAKSPSYQKQIPILTGSQIYHSRTCLEWITICDEGQVSAFCRHLLSDTFTQGSANSEYLMSLNFCSRFKWKHLVGFPYCIHLGTFYHSFIIVT